MRFGLGFGIDVRRGGFNPRSLFASGEQGIWLDPSDFSTLFQDATGTTPVTAVGQPVGKILDKSGRGNHATQTTAASRPTVEARVNLATATEGAAATWSVSNVVDATTPIAGFAQSLQFGDNSVARTSFKTITLSIGTAYAVSIFVEMDDGAAPVVGVNTVSGDFALYSEATIHTAVATVTRISGNIYRVSSSRTATLGGARFCGVRKDTTQSARTFRVIGIQVEEGTTATTYQRVNTATDYADVGAPRYLSFDGTDDGMVTPSIDFTGTDKMTVWAGVRKLSDAAVGILAELSTNSDSTNGTFNLAASVSGNNYYTQSRGTVRSSKYATGYVAPNSAVLVAEAKISTDTLRLHVNNAEPLSSATDQGTGNYGNYPLYIGRRGGTTLPFNGRLYQLIIRGAASSDGQIAAGEAWCNSKARAY